METIVDARRRNAASSSSTPAASPPKLAPKLRLHMLDSIRGWAAVQVLFFHVCHEMFGHALPELNAPWTNFVFNGAFAVAVFFVLSGEVLAHGYFMRGDLGIVRKLAIKRYVRLTIPIFVSCLAVFLLMKGGLIFSHEATPILKREDWLGGMLNFEASVRTFLSYTLFGVYFDPTPEFKYNPFLWTMSAEMLGSMFVFATLFLTRTTRQRAAVYALTAPFMAIYNPFLLGFTIGMIFGEMRAKGVFERIAAHRAANWAALFIVFDVALGVSLYPILPVPQGAVAHRITLAAAIFLFAVYSSSWLQRLFDNRLSHFIGELSFPIYLVHFPIIVSLQSFLVIAAFSDGVVTRPTAYAIMLATLAAAIAAAMAFRTVERFAIRASNVFFAAIDRL